MSEKKYILTLTPTTLPMREISQEVIGSWQDKINKLVKFDKSIEITGMVVDISALNEKDKYFVETEGGYPPTWITWWLNLTSEMWFNEKVYKYSGQIVRKANEGVDSILRLSFFDSPVINIPTTGEKHGYYIESLSPDDVLKDMYRPAWKMSADPSCAIAWGIDEDCPNVPFKCRGAILPVFDGLGFILITTKDEDKEKIFRGITEAK